MRSILNVLVCVAALVAGPGMVFGQGQKIEWMTTLSGPGNAADEPVGLAVWAPVPSTQANAIFVLAKVATTGGGSVWGIYRFNPLSAVPVATAYWPYDPFSATHSRAQHVPTAIAVHPFTGDVYVAGAIPSTQGTNYVTLRFNENLGLIWESQHYNGPGNGDDIPKAIHVEPPNNFATAAFVTGASQGTTTGTDIATVRLNASNGTIQWIHRFAKEGLDTPVGITMGGTCFEGGGILCIGGSSFQQGRGMDFVVFNLFPSNGTESSTQFWDNPAAHSDDTATSMAWGPGTFGTFWVFLSGTSVMDPFGDSDTNIATVQGSVPFVVESASGSID